MMQSVLIPFATILVAEFLDKSQLSVLLLSSKTKKHLPLLLGILLAFLIVDGLAIFFGSFLATLIPKFWLSLLSAGLFIFFGVRTLLEKSTDPRTTSSGKGVFLSGFTLIFLSEWGDKSQIASAVFATRYEPLLVLIGVMAALFLISVIAVFLGKTILSRFDRKLVTKVAGVLFILLGISFFFFR